MNASDCTPGDRVVIGGKYLRLGTPDNPIGPLFGVTATVVAVADRPCGDAYPYGMVTVDLPDNTTDWPVRRVNIGPEDLSPIPRGG
jgi:hypothetical protein